MSELSQAKDSRLSFDAYEADGSPRLFVGMFRPPLHEIDWRAYCNSVGKLSYGPNEPQDAWLRGTFDRALYATGADLAQSASPLPEVSR